MKPNRDTYPSGKEIIQEMRGDRSKGEITSLVDEIMRVLVDIIPASVANRGRPAAMAWLYRITREDYAPDGRVNLSHEFTIEVLLNSLENPFRFRTAKERALSRAGRKGGSVRRSEKDQAKKEATEMNELRTALSQSLGEAPQKKL